MTLMDHLNKIADERMYALARCPDGETLAWAVMPIVTIFWSYGEEDRDKAEMAVGEARVQRFRELAKKAGGMG